MTVGGIIRAVARKTGVVQGSELLGCVVVSVEVVEEERAVRVRLAVVPPLVVPFRDKTMGCGFAGVSCRLCMGYRYSARFIDIRKPKP